MTAFLLTIAFLAGLAVGAVLAICWSVASLMREADRGGWLE